MVQQVYTDVNVVHEGINPWPSMDLTTEWAMFMNNFSRYVTIDVFLNHVQPDKYKESDK